MFKEMKFKNRLLSYEKTLEIIKRGEYGVLSTTGADNYPYAVPLNYAYHNGKIYFHCTTLGHKIDNIRHNPNVSFCIVDGCEIVPKKFDTKFQSTILFGKAKEVTGEEKEEGLLAIIRRFSPEHMEAGKKYIKNASHKTTVIAIEIENATGKGCTDSQIIEPPAS